MKRCIILLSTILLASTTWSCASKKKTTSRDREHTVKMEKKNVQEHEQKNITSNAYITRTAYTTTYTPVDPGMDMTVNGQTSRNARLQETHETETHDLSTVDRSESTKSDTSQTWEETSKKHNQSNSNATRAAVWPWVIMGIIAILLAYLRIRHKLKLPFLP